MGWAALFTSRTISQFCFPQASCCELRDSYGLSLPWCASRLLVFDFLTDCLALAQVMSCCIQLTCLAETKDIRLCCRLPPKLGETAKVYRIDVWCQSHTTILAGTVTFVYSVLSTCIAYCRLLLSAWVIDL